jgi:phosphatidylglycerol:prolipoprotein diacylglycerol transferase
MITKTNTVILILFGLFLTLLIKNYPINPVAIDLNIVKVNWYGILFLTTIVIARIKLGKDIKKIDNRLQAEDADMLILCAMSGMLIGARLLYLIVYQGYPLEHYLSHPLDIIAIWKGGVSFHGGLIGLVIGVWIYSRKYKIQFLKCMDVIALTAPIGLAEGRIGNFINGELWGKVTDGPFGIVFQQAGSLPRHPSQIYEALLEGVVLFFILKAYSMKERTKGSICGLFMVMYAIFRFSVEFVREPDSNLGYIAFGWLTTGQLLCVPMLMIGLFVMNYDSIANQCRKQSIKGA